MNWLSWRQHRAETAALAGVVVVLCAAAVALGLTRVTSAGSYARQPPPALP